MTKASFYLARNKAIYDDFMAGKSYSWLSYHYWLSESGVKQVLQRYRAEHGLPKGRKK